jgi:hypothetical protein
MYKVSSKQNERSATQAQATEPIVFCKSHLCAFFFIEFLSGMCSTDFVITFDLRISKGTNDQKFLIFLL